MFNSISLIIFVLLIVEKNQAMITVPMDNENSLSIGFNKISYNQELQRRNYFDECFEKKLKLSCVMDKMSIAVESSMDMDIQLVPGLVLVRNELPLEKSTYRDNKFAIDRLSTALSNFMNTHSLNMEYGSEARRKKRRRYGILFAILGAFGITNAMILKGIAVVAAKALMVSKMALMISGIIGLKKLFQKDDGHEASVVQVHTLHDEHDRNVNTAMYNIRHL